VIFWQVGYHNEHHDFPSVAWTRLPALRALAPEFYDTIPSHPSWPMVTINFIRDKEVGLFSRAKRLNKGIKTAGPTVPGKALKSNDVSSDDDDSVSDSGVSICAGSTRLEERESDKKRKD
jgi:sphingolipid 4-desaturase/C4-monooxygenase